jgi:hypothetical protein
MPADNGGPTGASGSSAQSVRQTLFFRTDASGEAILDAKIESSERMVR